MSSDLWPLLGIPTLIFAARLGDVTLGTIRIIFVARGLRRVAPLIGFVEVLIWLVAIGQVMQHLDHPLNYLAYAGGFATGTYVGMLVEAKLAVGFVVVRAIARQDAGALVQELRDSHFGVTILGARGIHGRVRLVLTVLRRKDLPQALALIRRTSPAAFISVSDVREASEGFFPAGGYGPLRVFDFLRKGK